MAGLAVPLSCHVHHRSDTSLEKPSGHLAGTLEQKKLSTSRVMLKAVLDLDQNQEGDTQLIRRDDGRVQSGVLCTSEDLAAPEEHKMRFAKTDDPSSPDPRTLAEMRWKAS